MKRHIHRALIATCYFVGVMVKGKGTPTVDKEKEARQSKAWTLKEFGGKPLWDWMQLLLLRRIILCVTMIELSN